MNREYPGYDVRDGVDLMPTLTAAETFVPSEDFLRSLDQEPFVFEHTLHRHELFTLPRLKRLVEQIGALPEEQGRGKFFRSQASRGFFVRKGGPKLKWGSPEFQEALNEAFDDLDHSQTRIKLSSIHKIEGYDELLRDCTQQLSEVTGVDLEARYRPGLETLFITSPGQVTPYHIDEETNFLLQIHGRKDVHIYDGNDRAVVTPDQLEGFYGGKSFIAQNTNTPKIMVDLKAGYGVHNPPFFPHEVINGPTVSVSLSLGFERRRFPEGELHRMNLYLRKLGIKPSAPGEHPAADALKSEVMRRALATKRAVFGD